MAKLIFSRIGWFLFLMLLQIFIFNHIHIAGVATAFAYIYLLLILPNQTPKSLYVLTGFAMGLIVDVFNNTPGVSAAATTLVGLAVPYMFQLLRDKDEDDDAIVTPGAHSLGWAGFTYLALTCSLLQCLVFFIVDNFSFSTPLVLLIEIAGSTAFTLAVILLFEWVRHSAHR